MNAKTYVYNTSYDRDFHLSHANDAYTYCLHNIMASTAMFIFLQAIHAWTCRRARTRLMRLRGRFFTGLSPLFTRFTPPRRKYKYTYVMRVGIDTVRYASSVKKLSCISKVNLYFLTQRTVIVSN